MTEPGESRYPGPGCVAAELFGMSEDPFGDRFVRACATYEPGQVPADDPVDAEDMSRLEAFVRLHREILHGEGEGVAPPDGSCGRRAESGPGRARTDGRGVLRQGPP